MVEHISPSSVMVTEVSEKDILHIASVLSVWQEDSHFNRFLKESPVHPEVNEAWIRTKLWWEHSRAYVAMVQGTVAGLMLLHSFKHGKIEESIRVAPELQGRGIGTRLKRTSFQETLQERDIHTIISWHSAYNQGTFWTNARCGGTIADFVPDQTFLPNIRCMTDDFKWEITEIPSKKSEIWKITEGVRKHDIIQGLQKHKFIF